VHTIYLTGAFVVLTCAALRGRTTLSNVTIVSEVGGICSLHRATNGGGGSKVPDVLDGDGKSVAVQCTLTACSFNTTARATYSIQF
jgi:hypothetical protein